MFLFELTPQRGLHDARFLLLSGQLVIGKLVSVLSCPMSGVHVVVIVFGERVIAFQSKSCAMNLYASPMTDTKTTHHIGIWGLGWGVVGLAFGDWGFRVG